MGQKVNPHGARVGVIYDWSTRWYAGKKDFANNLNEDFRLRKMLKEQYYSAGISRIDIERSASRMTVTMFVSRPGMIIGTRGKDVDKALAILKFTPKAASPVIAKVLSSAIANAENNQDLDRSTLYVAECYANPGPTLKRYVARSRGSASPMLKRTCHISVVLDQKK